MLTLYGIKNCDTVRKARKWLDEQGLAYRFHDFRADGLERKRLQGWADELGWENLLNRRGTTWRRLPEADREGVDRTAAIRLMLDHPAIIKRPVLDTGKRRLLGFDPEEYGKLAR
jgi:arsenate reductase